MKIAIASDHAGFELKECLLKELKEKYEMVDFGAYNESSVDYPIISFKAAESVSKKECDVGILICGTGIGSSIAANKVDGIRAALCHCTEFAAMSRKHNDANIIVLPGRFVACHYAQEIVKVWLETQFEAGRHQRRVEQINEYENNR